MPTPSPTPDEVLADNVRNFIYRISVMKGDLDARRPDSNGSSIRTHGQKIIDVCKAHVQELDYEKALSAFKDLTFSYTSLENQRTFLEQATASNDKEYGKFILPKIRPTLEFVEQVLGHAGQVISTRSGKAVSLTYGGEVKLREIIDGNVVIQMAHIPVPDLQSILGQSGLSMMLKSSDVSSKYDSHDKEHDPTSVVGLEEGPLVHSFERIDEGTVGTVESSTNAEDPNAPHATHSSTESGVHAHPSFVAMSGEGFTKTEPGEDGIPTSTKSFASDGAGDSKDSEAPVSARGSVVHHSEIE